MYDPSRNTLFIHIPKTAGTSITKAFNFTLFHHHETAYTIKNLLRPNLWSVVNKFCVVRHPVDRMISLYYHCKIKTSFSKYIDDIYYCEDIPWAASQLAFIASTNKYIGKSAENSYEYVDKNVELIIDKIYFFESLSFLEKDFNIKLPKTNCSLNRKNFELSKKTLDQIYCMYETEFKILGYKL